MRVKACCQRVLPREHLRVRAAQYDDAREREVLFERSKQRWNCIRSLAQIRMEEVERACGCCAIRCIAGDVRKALQGKRRYAVAAGCGVVLHRLAAMEQCLVVMAGEEESACPRIFEALEQQMRKRAGEVQVDAPESGLHQFQQRIEQERHIVEVTGVTRT